MHLTFATFLYLSLLLLWTSPCNSLFRLDAANATYTSNTIVVPDDQLTIQDAVDIAEEGFTVLVRPGKYNECVRITKKSVKLIASNDGDTEIFSTGSSHTIEISGGANNVTVRGFKIKGTKGLLLSGIYVRSLYNVIENNLVTDHYYGIHIYDSTLNVLRNNSLEQNKYNLAVWGLFLPHFLNDIDTSNEVNGKPVHYLLNQRNKTISSADGYLALVNSSNVIIRDLNLSDNQCGILLAYTHDCLITNVTAVNNKYGAYLTCSNRNNITKNRFSNNDAGIVIISSDQNTISTNILSENEYDGIRLSHSYPLLSKYSEQNTIIANSFSDNGNGVYFEASHNNIATANVIINNQLKGMVLDESQGNVVTENIIENNSQGIYVYSSNNNFIYHNSFIENSIQVHVYARPRSTSINQWDHGYPSGGNLWTNYEGTDMCESLFQNITGHDGLGDTPHVIDENNKDNYPLMGKFSDFKATSEHHVQTICNSTISDFKFNGTAIIFNVTGGNATVGFCRICAPTALMSRNQKVFVNGTEVPYTLLLSSNSTHSYIYFTYNHSTQELVIITEFQSPIILPILLTATLLAIILHRRKSMTNTKCSPHAQW